MKDKCCHGHPDNGNLATQTESQRTETDLRAVNAALLEALGVIATSVPPARMEVYGPIAQADIGHLVSLAHAAIEAAKGD